MVLLLNKNLSNGEQLLTLIRILHLLWKRFQVGVEFEVSQCHTLFLWRAALGLIEIFTVWMKFGRSFIVIFIFSLLKILIVKEDILPFFSNL